MELKIEAEKARTFCLDVLDQVGVPTAAAQVCAESLIDASLRGVDSHGVALLTTYVERIHSGQIKPGGQWIIRRESPTTALCDGRHGLGPPLACDAVDLAVEKAQNYGLGAVSLFDSNYLGALSFYVRRIAERGAIGLCTANATPRVAPFGGRQGLHGTNPIAYAAPTQTGEPLVFDTATGHAAARIHQALDEGRPLNEGVALDAQGEATTDPQTALQGWLLPVGGTIGYGLGLLADLLSGGLTGGPCGKDVPPVTDMTGPYGCGFFALAIDPECFGGRDVFAERCSFLVDSARAVPPAAGFDQVRVPGDRAGAEQEHRLSTGIPFAARRWQAILDRLAACDVDVEGWRSL